MINPHGWRENAYYTAEQWREAAASHDALAEAARKDGDYRFVDIHKRDAALCRENARLKEHSS